ncbi:MAG: DUF2505 domain-containing protein [Actinomycetota bacterium]|nr:DUF2505 domain-containing protein [Actinomycetota bacterium]
MKISESYEYPAPPADVATMLADPAFQAMKCEATRALSHTESVTREGDTTRITTRRVMPTDSFPSFVGSMIGSTITVVETYLWSAASGDGSRTGTVTVDIGDGNLPIRMAGTLTLEPHGAGSVIRLDGELRAKVVLIGGKIEKAAEPAVHDAIEKERQTGMRWLGA